jgi:hypothetical protein
MVRATVSQRNSNVVVKELRVGLLADGDEKNLFTVS